MPAAPKTSNLSRWVDYYKSVHSRIHVDVGFFKSAISVAKIYVYFVGQRFRLALGGQTNRRSIAFYPQPAGPWYNIWITTQLLEMKISADEESADHIFVFDDLTQTDSALVLSERNLNRAINRRARDIGKDYIGDVFNSVFGYSIAVDPTKFSGSAVCKYDVNGTHDGTIVECPIEQEDVVAGQAYQRLIDSTFNGKTAEDLRIAFVFGKIAVVYHKHKSLEGRFGTTYLSTDLFAPLDVFSQKEVDLITEFCEKVGLDYGAVDVMRDKHDGRIYIVDVNKTCMPVLSLSFKEQMIAQKRIALEFSRGLESAQY